MGIVFPALFGECLVRTNYEKTPSAAADLWACPAMLQLFFFMFTLYFLFFCAFAAHSPFNTYRIKAHLISQLPLSQSPAVSPFPHKRK